MKIGIMNKYRILGLFALLASIGSCAKNDMPEIQNKSVSVLEYTGEEVPLDLEADLETDELRAAVYDHKNEMTAGRTPKLILPSKVPVRVYIRKKGEYAATISSVTLEGTVKTDGAVHRVRVNGKIKLRKPGQTLKEGDWQVLCVIGGKSIVSNPQSDADNQPGSGGNANFDHVAHKVDPTPEWTDPEPSYGSYAGNTVSYSDAEGTKILSMMPWMTNWSPLTTYKTDPSSDGAGQNLKLRFKPKGVLLRVKPRSNMVLDLKLKYLKIKAVEKHLLHFGGRFNLLEDHPDFPDEPRFYSTYTPEYGEDMPSREFVELNLTDQPLLKSGEELDRTIYVWVMPGKSVAKQNKPLIDIELRGYTTEEREPNVFSYAKQESLYLGMWSVDPRKEANSKNINRGKEEFFASYTTRQSVDAFEQGHTYTFKPILSSSLMITEVFVRPAAVPKTNDENDPHSNATYTSTWGGIELYNPTLTPINLADYGVLRVKATQNDRPIEYYRFEAHPSNGTLDLNHAIVQPLTFLDGEVAKTFSGGVTSGYVTKVRRVHGAYTAGATLLQPGKTFVVLDASYVRHNGTRPGAINVDNVISVGVQIEEAFNLGYCQAAVALDNGKDKTSNNIHWQSNDAPVMAGGPQDIYLLVKKNNSGGYDRHDVAGDNPHESSTLYENGEHEASYWSGSRYGMWGARHGREGNVRTRFVPVLKPDKDRSDFDEWGYTPSLERGDDYVNNFATLGSRYWLGPTEKSRLGEWSAVPAFAVPTRKWRIQQ